MPPGEIALACGRAAGAMQTVLWAMNMAYQRDETRNFVKKRLIAVAMII
jgi:uncharacterized BrkB/YihY/UPF0761 family membrane protein